MAITSKEQILDMSDVNAALEFLDKAVINLQNAKSDLQDIRKKCNKDVVSIDGVISPSVKVNETIAKIELLILNIRNARTEIHNDAKEVRTQEKKEYQEYKEEEKRKEEEKNKKKGDD